MKVKLFLALMFTLFVFGASAQNPIEKLFKVEFRTAAGKDTVIEVSSLGINSFNFIGNKGEVQRYNEAIGEWETIEEDNKDIYLNVTNVAAFNANISVEFSDAVKKLSFEKFGCCISKSLRPEVADSAFALSNYTVSCDLSGFFDENENGCYTINIDKNEIEKLYIEIQNLDYVTTYYVRPYVKLSNGFIMYGGEKSFASLKTKEAALKSEEELKGRYLVMEDSVVFTKEALQGLFDNDAEVSNELWYGMIKDFKCILDSMADDEKAELREKIYKTINCIDGNLHLIKSIPAKVVEYFKEYFVGGVEFSPIGMVYRTISCTPESPYVVYCDESKGVPYNSYLAVVGLSKSSNQAVELNIPKYLHNKEYAVYAVFVHPDSVNPLPNYFDITIEQQRESEDYSVPGGYKQCFKQREITTDASNSVDTVFIGNFTSTGTPNAIIQFKNVVKRQSSWDAIYDRILRIAKICIVPVKEDE